MGKNDQILEVKTAQNGNRNNILTTAPLLGRGMNVEEAKALCTSPLISLREKLFFRILYETGLRPMEALNLRIENWDRERGEIVAIRVKQKFNRWAKNYKLEPPRHILVTPNTNEMLRFMVSTRKKGYIFEGGEGKPLTKRYMQQQVDKYARLLSIQKTRKYSDDGRELPLITLMALRKAGERHHDAAGGDSSLSAQSCGHSMRTKVLHYQGEVDWESVHSSYRAHHPAFTKNW